MTTAYDLANRLPGIEAVRDRARALAILSAIFSPDRPPDERDDSYNCAWRPGEELASMNKGTGDEYKIIFSQHGALAFGLDHEIEMSPYGDRFEMWPGVIDDVPAEFRNYLDEPEFQMDDLPLASVCLWRKHSDDRWQAGTIEFPREDPPYGSPDGSDWLFDRLIEPAENYHDWAKSFFGHPDLELEPVRAVFDLQPLTQQLVAAVNPEVELAALGKDITIIGYPV